MDFTCLQLYSHFSVWLQRTPVSPDLFLLQFGYQRFRQCRKAQGDDECGNGFFFGGDDISLLRSGPGSEESKY